MPVLDGLPEMAPPFSAAGIGRYIGRPSFYWTRQPSCAAMSTGGSQIKALVWSRVVVKTNFPPLAVGAQVMEQNLSISVRIS